jgi:trimethylamine corrinoid protein
MATEEFVDRLYQATLDLEDDRVLDLLREGVDAGVAPVDMILEALSPALNAIGEQVKQRERPVSDMVIAGEILKIAVRSLRPVMEARGQPTGDTLVIGTVEGSRHNVEGKQIVAAVFAGAGYRVVDLGEDVPAREFARAAAELGAAVVGASALGSLKPECRRIHDALAEAGIRDGVIYIIGGWGITEAWCDGVGADAYGENARDALDKVQALRRGDLPRWRERANRIERSQGAHQFVAEG